MLCWISSSLAVFSCGQAVNTNAVSIYGVIGVTIGIWFSYLARAVIGRSFLAKADGVLYCVVAWVGVIVAKQLNVQFFPPDTFPSELTPSSWLFWMTILGSFFAWRDGTLIFQSIPALAIFGFVGCYDTFKFVVVLFFLFLICFATLFARAHGRDMQLRAVESGYFLLGRSAHMNPYEQSMALREGPWRWAAGAEWALGSALLIIILSSIGAPVVQATAKPLSGIISIRPPQIRNSTSLQNGTLVSMIATVGNGPVKLGDNPAFEVSGKIPTYLRIGTFNVWNGRAWSMSLLTGDTLLDRMTGDYIGMETPTMIDKFRYPNKKPNSFPDEYHSQMMSIRSLTPTRELPQWGNDPTFLGNKSLDRTNGGLSFIVAERSNYAIAYDKVPEPKMDSQVPKVLDFYLYSHMNTPSISETVKQLAATVTKGITNDYEKALALQREVTGRIQYNTNASATPEGKDPIEFALTESHEGYCDLFASSMVQLARCAKIPARYVIGYLPDSKNRNSSGTQLLLDSDRHAWAELYFESIGWVPFDATAGATVVAGGGRKDNKPTDYTGLIRLAGIVLNVLIGLAVISGIWLFVRMRNMPKSVAMIRSELDSEYVTFIGSIWKHTGHRRLLSETTNEYLYRVGEQLGEMRSQAEEIGLMFTNKMFGQPEVLPEDVAEVRDSVQSFKGLLAKRQKSR